MQKPGLPKGTRDFSAQQLVRRRFIFETIRLVFEKYGFNPLETPSMELLQTLTGKYGDEGDMLLFKVLNNGDFLAKADEQALKDKNSNALVFSISKRALRYDLTVPFARYIVMNQHLIQFPFKRFQMQPVWRADRPQKGRYQEFYQCDADVVGSDSLIYEAEFVQIYDEVFTKLGMSVEIRINNRKILAGIAEKCGLNNQFSAFTIELDKLDKIGLEGVIQNIKAMGISNTQIEFLTSCLQSGNNLELLEELIGDNQMAALGIAEVKQVMDLLSTNPLHQKLVLDITLARGLNYYTGCIFEVKSLETEMGSIGGGGRYDNLTGTFGLAGVSGVGISFGAERIYDILETLSRWPLDVQKRPLAIVLPMGEEQEKYSFKCASILRSQGLDIDIYPDSSKFKKAMKYASDRQFRYALICGETEFASSMIAVKDLDSGVQQVLSIENTAKLLNSR
jgi:histidyl-tRNA synthetase